MADDCLMKVDNDDVDYNVLCERLVDKGVISEQDKQHIQGKPATEQKEFIIRKAVAAGQDSIEEYINCLKLLTNQKVGSDVIIPPDGRIIEAAAGPREGLPDTVGVAFSDGGKVYVFTPWHLFTDSSGLEAVEEEKPVFFEIQYENGEVKFAERGQLIVCCPELDACIHHVTGVSIQRIRRGPMVVAVTSNTYDVIQGTAVLLINKFMWSGDGKGYEFHGHTAVPVPHGHTADPVPQGHIVVALPSPIADMEVIFRDKTTVRCQKIEKCRSCECLKFQLDPTMLPELLKRQLLNTLAWKVGSSDVKRLMAQQNETSKITEENLKVVDRVHRLSLHRNAEIDLQSMDTAHMTPTDTTPCRSTDVRDKVHTKSRQKRDGLRILRREAEQLNLKNKATRIEEDQESNSDELTDDKVGKEIQMFEKENARLRQEHQLLLALPEKIPTGHRIPDEETDQSEYQLLERSKMAHKTKGKMPEKDFERMRRNYVYLQDHITDPHRLINNLFSKGVLDDDDVTMINYAKKHGRGLERDRVQKLVDILMLQRAGSFQMFLQCLEETGLSDIAIKLEYDPSEYQLLESLMAQQNKKRKITEEKPEVIDIMHRLSRHRNAETDLQSMDTAGMTPTDTTPCRSTDVSLMAQQNKKRKITEEKPEVVDIMHRLSRHRNAETDLQSMDTARMTPTDTTPCRSTDVRDKVHTKSRQKRDGLRILRREAEQLNLKNKVLKATRIEEDQESKSGTLPADLSRALLPVKECSKIKEHLIFLTDELVPDHFIPFLFSNNVINDEQREGLVEVFDNQGGRKCTETLLYILMYECSETRAYGLFCQCLHEKMYYKALQKLEPNRTDITDEQLKTSRGKLPEKEYSVLQDHIELLTRGIVPSGYIMHLYSGTVFTEEDKERLNAIENKKGKTACVDAMLFLLLRCGEFGFQQFLQYLNKKNLSIFNILYPGNKKDGLAVKYSEGQHEYVFNTESVEYKEFTDRVLSNVKELLFGTMVTVVDVRKGCVQVIFEINSLDKTDKDKLEAVLQKALKSGCIGPDAISYLEFKPIDDDELTDEEVEKEIQMFEEENARLRQEHQRLLALPEKIPTGHRIPDKKTDELTDEEVGKEIPMFEEEKVTALPEKIPTPLMYKGFRIPDTKTGRRRKKRGPMKDDDVHVIMENYVCLVETIDVQYVQPFLILEFILNRRDVKRLKKASTVSRENATEELLNIVMFESGSDVFPIFVKCLYDAGYEDIISKLQPASGYIGHDAIDDGRRGKKRGPMKDDDASIIMENYVCLVETINVQYVQPFLILEFILDRKDIDRLKKASTVSRRKATEELLNIVIHESGSDVFPIFVKCIFDAGYENIASKLQPSLYI